MIVSYELGDLWGLIIVGFMLLPQHFMQVWRKPRKNCQASRKETGIETHWLQDISQTCYCNFSKLNCKSVVKFDFFYFALECSKLILYLNTFTSVEKDYELARAEVKEKVEVCLCSFSGSSWPVLGRNLHFTLYRWAYFLRFFILLLL